MSTGATAMRAGLAALVLAAVAVVASALPAQAATTVVAYVANQNDGTVSAIDTATNTVIATVPVGSDDPRAVAVTRTAPASTSPTSPAAACR
ncbi:hypothetical protein NKG94_30975 [Micromonospora sp. M12]